MINGVREEVADSFERFAGQIEIKQTQRGQCRPKAEKMPDQMKQITGKAKNNRRKEPKLVNYDGGNTEII